MRRLAEYPKGTPQSEQLFAMLNTLIDECRYFAKYPMEELNKTAQLFGLCIKQEILNAYSAVKVVCRQIPFISEFWFWLPSACVVSVSGFGIRFF